MNEFISDCSDKTSKLHVTVYNHLGKMIKIYDTPHGFQLEKYISSLWPNLTLQCQFPLNKNNDKNDFKVSVYDEEKLIEIHYGVYI